MKKVFLVLAMILITSTCLAQQYQFSMSPMFLKNKIYADESVKSLFAWEFGASLIDKDISINYKNRVWPDLQTGQSEIKWHRAEFCYNYNDLRPFISGDWYKGSFMGGLGLKVIGKVNRGGFFDITGGGYTGEYGGYTIDGKIGIQRNGYYAAVGYSHKQFGKDLNRETYGAIFGEFGLLFF